ncbi:Mrp/NBP35 family ATP-binding protein [Pseudophaeobacter flagellatus]|uniref:Mrp/NBP35 family ATP-binding protein n=1 Tax=Pseudophaeobacter flagellatus TaxID=2899119 RepID=UPI001E41E56D|nr:Mrp/NBP35 family ATP-binding protein [Pseudophaeobacter flagellatus]MCD9146348.1 Mrp/NBP35 family ATP-binding protein [Pseudophaeobacter flagellatus]
MSVSENQIKEAQIKEALARLALPDGGTLISRDMIRALTLQPDAAEPSAVKVSFVIEAPSPEIAQHMEPLRRAAEAAVLALAGVGSVSAALTAHGPASTAPSAKGASGAPSFKFGGHAKPQAGPIKPAGVARILAVASGKGGVGKSTVSANLAVALSRQGRRVGLLDADIYGPSQPRMMGITGRPGSADGKVIEPLQAHGVTVMSIGLMVPEDKAIVWRGPMLMGALQQMLGQVNWGELDVLIVDLPPGTGDVQLTLCTKSELSGAIVVSTPQDVALIDARKALDMFKTLKTPVLGLIENMSFFTCPDCGGEHHIFGHGGVAAEAKALGLPLLGALPIDLETRLAGDAGQPVAAGDGAIAQAYGQIAKGLIAGGMA